LSLDKSVGSGSQLAFGYLAAHRKSGPKLPAEAAGRQSTSLVFLLFKSGSGGSGNQDGNSVEEAGLAAETAANVTVSAEAAGGLLAEAANFTLALASPADAWLAEAANSRTAETAAEAIGLIFSGVCSGGPAPHFRGVDIIRKMQENLKPKSCPHALYKRR